MTNKQTNNVKFFYLHDPKEPRRVLTVARSVSRHHRPTVFVGWAVSHPTTRNLWGELTESGDQFCKARGRQIALGRMDKRTISATLQDNHSPLVEAMLTLSVCEELPRRVRKFVGNWLEENGYQETTYRPLSQKEDEVLDDTEELTDKDEDEVEDDFDDDTESWSDPDDRCKRVRDEVEDDFDDDTEDTLVSSFAKNNRCSCSSRTRQKPRRNS